MRRVVFILAPGTSVTCLDHSEALSILRIATDRGLVATLCPDGFTVRCEPLARAAAPGFVESQLATERARVVELERQLQELRTAQMWGAAS